MAEEENKEATEEVEESSPSGANKIVLILTAVNLVCTMGIIGALVVSFQKEKTKPGVEDIATEAPEAEGGHGEGDKAKAEGHGEGGGGGHGEAAGGHGEGGGGHGEGGKAASSGGHNFGKMVTLENFTVNLSTIGSVVPRFARVSMSLQVLSDDTEQEINQKMPQVRNAIIDLFNSKQPSDLDDTDERNSLKREILKSLNGFLVTGKVEGVYFTNFALST